MNQPKRPLVRYHGGKWRLAPWIIENLPEHRIYVEPFGGGGSVLLRKARCHAEVYNDLDGEIVNLFRVARQHGGRLTELLRMTPFARSEYLEAWYPSEDPLEQARRTVVRSFMGFGSASVTMTRAPKSGGRGGLATTGFRANSNKSGSTPAKDWANYPDALGAIIERLQGVVIENRDALVVMGQHDSPNTLHYVDPPYVAETRDRGEDYRHELDTEGHERLSETLHGLLGMVVLSGYPSDMYDHLYGGWVRMDHAALADGGRPRTECLWLNNAAQERLFQRRLIA